MLKSILNLEGVTLLDKIEQKEVNGGVFKPSPIAVSCDVFCGRQPYPANGTPCGPSHCPGQCNGHGGADRY